MVVALMGGFAPGAQASHGGFQGVCTPDAGDTLSGSCKIDESSGHNAATHGSATYSRDGDTLTFVFDVDAVSGPIQQIQVCATVITEGSTNPYVPVGNSNPCAGQGKNANPDRIFNAEYEPGLGTSNSPDVTVVADLTLIPGYQSGDPVYFGVHITTGSLTTYIVGGAYYPQAEQTGALLVSKLLTGNPTGFDLNQTFTFHIDCDGTEFDQDVEVVAGGSQSITDIPLGTSCVVSETALPSAGNGAAWDEPSYKDSENGQDGNGEQTVTILDSEGESVTVTNHRTLAPVTGQLTVTKVVTGELTGLDVSASTFSFTVNCDGDEFDTTVQIQGNGSAAPITGIPAATSCIVSETNLPPAGTDATWATPEYADSEAGDSDGEQTVTITDALGESVTVVNIRSIDDGEEEIVITPIVDDTVTPVVDTAPVVVKPAPVVVPAPVVDSAPVVETSPQVIEAAPQADSVSPPTVAPAVHETTVLDATVTRELPRTGVDLGNYLLMAGLAMLVGGALLLVSERFRPAEVRCRY